MKKVNSKKFLFDKTPYKTLNLIKNFYPEAHCELNHKNAFELLIATILSAQCTDERVNQVTKILFKNYPTPQSLSKASIKEIEDIIRPTGFYKNKAKNIKECSTNLVIHYSGKVPQNSEQLVQLPGVGRKTANVVLGVAFKIPNGIVVDTHVSRISQRLGFSKNKTPDKIESDLAKIFKKDEWIMLSHYLIFHGRKLCKARNPDCKNCFLFKTCPQNDYQ